MNVFDLSKEYRELEALAEGMESEADANAMTALYAEIDGKAEEKAESLIKLIREAEGEAEIVGQLALELKDKMTSHANRAARLRDLLEIVVKSSPGQKIRTPIASAWIGESKSAFIADESALPADCIRIVPETRLANKAEILKRLKAGDVVPGAVLATKEFLTIK